MRLFAAVATFGLAAFAAAQDTTASASASNVAASTTESAASTATSDSAEAKCLQKCGAADICCQARCVGVPCPSDLNANQTTECAASCDQGNGSQSDTEAYASCQLSCISSSFFPLSATAAASGADATATGADATTTGAGATGVGASGTGFGFSSGTASATGSGASASASEGSNSDNSAQSIKNGVAGAGLLGLIVAGLAF